MNKNVVSLGIINLIFTVLTTACVSFGDSVVRDTSKSGIIIERIDFLYYADCPIFIDGKSIGKIKVNEIKGYELENGRHTIRFYENGGWFHKVELIINNDRHYFKIELNFSVAESLNIIEYGIYPVVIAEKPKSNALIDRAINNSFNVISQNLSSNVKIALINIASPDSDESSFILEELTVLFVNARKYTIVDRQTLNVIRREQNFQLSGEVSDEMIVSIGNFIGADIVITGSVSGSGERKRLRLRALDVKTAQLLAASSEQI